MCVFNSTRISKQASDSRPTAATRPGAALWHKGTGRNSCAPLRPSAAPWAPPHTTKIVKLASDRKPRSASAPKHLRSSIGPLPYTVHAIQQGMISSGLVPVPPSNITAFDIIGRSRCRCLTRDRRPCLPRLAVSTGGGAVLHLLHDAPSRRFWSVVRVEMTTRSAVEAEAGATAGRV